MAVNLHYPQSGKKNINNPERKKIQFFFESFFGKILFQIKKKSDRGFATNIPIVVLHLVQIHIIRLILVIFQDLKSVILGLKEAFLKHVFKNKTVLSILIICNFCHIF